MGTLVNVFAAPGAAFRKLKEKPVWVLPMIVFVVFSLALTYVAIAHTDLNDMRSRVEDSMRSRGISEEQIQKNVEQWEKVMGNPVMRFAFPTISSLVVTVAMLLVLSLILMPLVPAAGGTAPNFGLNLSIVTHASMVAVLGMILKGILIFLRGPMHADIGLSLFAPALKAGFLQAFLTRIDLFSVWNTVLVALGLKVGYDLKDNRIYYYIFALWIAFLLISSLIGGRQMMVSR